MKSIPGSASLYHLVYNKVAGRGRMPNAREVVRDFFNRNNMQLEELPDVSGAELTALLRELPADARILSLGGDGTLNGVLPATVGTGRTVGILPAGSADDFATALGLPRDDLQPALEAVKAGRIRRVDTAAAALTRPGGEVVHSRFVNALGTGFDAEVASVREASFNWLRGSAGYYTALALGWLRMKREQVTVSADGVQLHSGPSLLVSFQNSMRTGGSFHFVPGAEIDDGRFNLVVAGDIGRRKIIRLLPMVLKPEPWEDVTVVRVTGTRFTLEWAAPRTVHMDGEIHAPALRVQVEVQPASLQVFAP